MKMTKLQYCAQTAFDGSRRLSYTTVSLTVGNREKNLTVSRALRDNGKENYCSDQSGKYIHVDERNATNSPCVAITLGAYDGFLFCLPSLNLELHAPSGTAIIGPFSHLLHAVGGGTGVRVTSVYCQHEDIATGVKLSSIAPPRKLTTRRFIYSQVFLLMDA